MEAKKCRPEGLENPYKPQPNNLSMTPMDRLFLAGKEEAYEAGADAMLVARDKYIRQQLQAYVDSKITLTELCVSLGWKFEEIYPAWAKYKERIERNAYQGMDVEIIEEMIREGVIGQEG